jgi:hypothetical protein
MREKVITQLTTVHFLINGRTNQLWSVTQVAMKVKFVLLVVLQYRILKQIPI